MHRGYWCYFVACFVYGSIKRLRKALGIPAKVQKNRRPYLYVHSKLYYGIQCRKHFPSQCKWPAQYYTVENKNQYITHRKKVERKSCFLFYSTALSWASKEPPKKNQGACKPPPVRFTYRSPVFFCWCSSEMVRWPDYMKHDLISDVLIPCFLHPAAPLCPCWSHPYTDDTVGPLRRQKKCELMAERWAACLRGCGGVEGWVGGWGRDVLWKESILYSLSAWLDGYSSGTASHFLSNCSTCSICRQQNDKKEKKNNPKQTANDRTGNTIVKVTKKQKKNTYSQRILTHRPPTLGHFQQ